MSYKDTIRAVLNFHFKHHRHGMGMPHEEHVPHFNLHRKTLSEAMMHVGVDGSTQADINKETDDLFWAKTGYKVGQKLSATDAEDKKWIPVWMTFYNQVKLAHGISSTPAPATAGFMKQAANVISAAPISQADVHSAQADIHQAQADFHTAEAATQAKAAIAAAADTVKAAEHIAQSNLHNEQAQTHQEQADNHKAIVENLKKVNSLSALAYLAVKSWAETPSNSQYFGWAIHKNGNVDTKWTDSADEINNWFGNLGLGTNADVIWGAYYQKGHTDASGALTPVDEFTPSITQDVADAALNNALGRNQPSPQPQTYAAPAPQQSGGGGAAIGLVLGLGVLGVAASKGKRR